MPAPPASQGRLRNCRGFVGRGRCRIPCPHPDLVEVPIWIFDVARSRSLGQATRIEAGTSVMEFVPPADGTGKAVPRSPTLASPGERPAASGRHGGSPQQPCRRRSSAAAPPPPRRFPGPSIMYNSGKHGAAASARHDRYASWRIRTSRSLGLGVKAEGRVRRNVVRQFGHDLSHLLCEQQSDREACNAIARIPVHLGEG
jgi:hypothetical protein